MLVRLVLELWTVVSVCCKLLSPNRRSWCLLISLCSPLLTVVVRCLMFPTCDLVDRNVPVVRLDPSPVRTCCRDLPLISICFWLCCRWVLLIRCATLLSRFRSIATCPSVPLCSVVKDRLSRDSDELFMVFIGPMILLLWATVRVYLLLRITCMVLLTALIVMMLPSSSCIVLMIFVVWFGPGVLGPVDITALVVYGA